MKVKVGDKVKILTGKDKGKEGKVTLTFRAKDRVVVEGINKVKKHNKPGRQGESGSIVETEAAIHVSNVKVIEAGKRDTKKDTKKEKPVKEEKVARKATKKSTKKEEVGEDNE